MPTEKLEDVRRRHSALAREIHEITYWKHCTGASESQVRAAIARVGTNRDKVEGELKRLATRES